jgi:hypothetical protein
MSTDENKKAMQKRSFDEADEVDCPMCGKLCLKDKTDWPQKNIYQCKCWPYAFCRICGDNLVNLRDQEPGNSNVVDEHSRNCDLKVKKTMLRYSNEQKAK